MNKTYLFFIAEDSKEDAIASVESWLDEYLSREFYYRFSVTGNVYDMSYLTKTFVENSLRLVESRLDIQRIREEEARVKGDREAEGIAACVVGDILCERLCEDMPWYNLDTMDWSVPDGVDNIGRSYYVVEVEF